jgi:hypothetical protein
LNPGFAISAAVGTALASDAAATVLVAVAVVPFVTFVTFVALVTFAAAGGLAEAAAFAPFAPWAGGVGRDAFATAFFTARFTAARFTARFTAVRLTTAFPAVPFPAAFRPAFPVVPLFPLFARCAMTDSPPRSWAEARPHRLTLQEGNQLWRWLSNRCFSVALR